MLVSEIRRARGMLEIPIVVVGGERAEALGAGADAHLPGDASPLDLEAVVSELLELI